MRKYVQYNKGKTFEEVFGEEKAKEIKEKMSENAKNNPSNNQFKKGHGVPEEWRKKIRKAAKQSTGENSRNWKGGITNKNRLIRWSKKNKEFKKRIFERDDYTCQICGKCGGDLNCHHIKSWAKYPDLRFDEDNVITLCVKCHREIHFGRRD